MKWFSKFWEKHGERITWMALAMTFAVPFVIYGNDQLKGSGYTIMIGAAMLCFNKARGEMSRESKNGENE